MLRQYKGLNEKDFFPQIQVEKLKFPVLRGEENAEAVNDFWQG